MVPLLFVLVELICLPFEPKCCLDIPVVQESFETGGKLELETERLLLVLLSNNQIEKCDVFKNCTITDFNVHYSEV